MGDVTERLVSDELGGMVFDLDEGVMVTDVVLIAKTVRIDDGTVGLYLAQTEGVSWIEKLGMLRAAERLEGADLVKEDGDED